MPTVLKAFPTEVLVLRSESYGEVRTYFSAEAAAGGIFHFLSPDRPLWLAAQIVRAGLAVASLTDLTVAVRTALAALPAEPAWPGVPNQRPPEPLLKQYNAAVSAWDKDAKKALVVALNI